MNEGKFFEKAFYKKKSFTIDEFLEKVSFKKTKLYKLFKQRKIEDKYKLEIENALGIKFPVPEKIIDKEFEENIWEIKYRKEEEKNISLEKKYKIACDELEVYKKQIEKLTNK